MSDNAKVQTVEDLDHLLEVHQTLLTNRTLAATVEGIPQNLAETAQAEFLRAVVYYDQQHSAPAGQPKDWEGAYAKFFHLLEVMATTPMLHFYVPNYAFLAGRNAGRPRQEIEPHFQIANQAAQRLPPPWPDQLLGFILYNWARYLLKEKDSSALGWYIAAGEARIRYYEHVKKGSDEAATKAAATQVWKIREDWAQFFPDVTIGRCPVSEKLFAEVEPLANPHFSARTSI